MKDNKAKHLIENAIKFNNSDDIHIELGWSLNKKGDPEMFVRDNGLGIEERYHEQIFRVFERLHTRRKFEGTGIGLAIVKKAVQKLNGSVRVESKPGEGSTFFVTLTGIQKDG